MANRLSEHPHVTVLLIEAGGKENILTKVAGLAPLTQFSKIDWDFLTVPQEHACFGLDNQVSAQQQQNLSYWTKYELTSIC